MGNNNLKTTNDILVKVDQNNLIYIDPNSIVSNGLAVPRSVEPENLVMYVNLEADLVPRTTLISSENVNTLLSIAKGTLNFMKNPNGRDFDTKWTDAYTDVRTKSSSSTSLKTDPSDNTFIQNDPSGQSFGIDNISIRVAGANFIPTVVIKFIDVRGKTLFDSPANSPYAAFFHLPWPIFYLTVKGYYGKAIKYRLHMIKFNSRYNSTYGNFEVDATFIGSTYAYLADISLEAVLNAPYFYISENVNTTTFNEETGYYDINVSKTTKGYRMLKSVYQEYINMGLLPSDFPVRTLREVIVIAGRLNKILERAIFDQTVDPKVLSGVKEYEDQIQNFATMIESWRRDNIGPAPNYFTTQEKRPGTDEYIRWYEMITKEKDTLVNITGRTITATLEFKINNYLDQLENNQTFGVKRDNKLIKNDKFKIKVISVDALKTISNFYRRTGTYGIDIDGILDIIVAIETDFVQQRNKLETDIEEKMNEIVRDKNIGIGFEPTIRNIVGVLLANAETYIRLMKDVHEKAFNMGHERKKLLENVLTDSVGESIYPWPEIKAKNSGGKEIVLVYPGGKEMGDKLHASDTNLWPEVDFVENFYEVATKKADNLANREGNPENINYIFSTAINMAKKDIAVLTNISGYLPYGDKSPSSILYEIYERAKYTTALNPFSNDVMMELADVEFDNLQNQITEDIDLVDILKAYVTNYGNLLYYMGAFSTFDRYPYYQDQLPTVPYIKDVISQDYSVNKYQLNYNTPTNKDLYPKLSQFLLNYKPESYRTKIYPFNSSTYLNYLGQKTFTENDLHLNGLLYVNAPDDFITSPINPQMFVNDGYIHNLFQYTVNIGGINKHLLNTPYFHKQLYNDFIQPQSSGKYVGSAYLLLNSLPFKDLGDKIMPGGGTISGTNTLISTLFREIGATHYIPYHMMLKWGSIYHRYKRYINDSVDIINNVTNPIDGDLYFDNNLNRVYTGSTNPGVDVIDRTNLNDVGIHPFYDTIFHQIANGYAFFDFVSGPTGYSQTISSDITKIYYREANGGYAWSTFVDESKFTTTDNRYTLLPSNGYNDIDINDFPASEQENFRIIWNVGTDYSPNLIDYQSHIFPSSYEYFKLTGGTYSLSTNYRKVIDLIATFKPDILDVFEQAFLDFASEKVNAEIPYKPYDVKYSNFQDLLKDIVSVEKIYADPTDINGLLTIVKERQLDNLTYITSNMLSTDSLIRISLANPREVDNYLLGQFTSTGFTMNEFDPSQVTSNIDNIKLYLGEDLDGYYQDFFSTINIELNEENIKQFRPLIYMYAGLRANGQDPTKEVFISYVKDNVTSPPPFKIDSISVSGPDKRLEVFLDQLINRIQKDLKSEKVQTISKKRGYSDDIIKLELYNLFKSFNDKWTSGNSMGQRTLMEEFLFLDKANRDIGSSVYIDMEKLMRLTDKGNEKINLFSALSLLVQDTGFDIRALPAYVNFYGTNFSNTKKITPSKTVAENMFGSFMNIDYVDSSPKIILQYIGPTSKHLEMSDIDFKYKYKNDGFNIGDVNNNPIIIASDVFTRMDFAKSNKVVAFEVSFGDQNQSIFKGVELDQTSIKNTSESFIVLDRLGRSESGSSTAQIDVGLFDIYRQSSYQCQVTAMGNVMIQPTMYFYLKNIPLFRGSYWITEVTHTIRTTGIETTFKGSRIPLQSLPNPADSFLASYRSLFDRMVKRAEVKVKEASFTANTINDVSVSTDAGNFTYNMGNITIPGEKIVSPPGVTPYGVPYNGFDGEKYIQKVSYPNDNVKWLRVIAVQMGGPKYPIDSGITMTILTNLTVDGINTPHQILWNDIEKLSDKQDFYVTKFNMGRITADYLITHFHSTVFLNPNIQNGPREVVTTNMNNANKTYMGPVSVGPAVSDDILQTLPSKPMGIGIGLSKSLMGKLRLLDGQVVYFNMIE